MSEVVKVFGGMALAAPVETIDGQIVAKANNYMAVPDASAPGGRRIIKNDKVRAYEKSFAEQCRKYAGKMICKPFELVVTVFYKSQVYDLDNSLKTLLDCLQYVKAITDDKLCIRISADKRIDPYRPRVEFALITTPPERGLFD